MKDDPAIYGQTEAVVLGWWCKMSRDLGNPARLDQHR